MNLDFLRPYVKDPYIVDRVHVHDVSIMFKGYVACTIGHHVFILKGQNKTTVMIHEIKHVEQVEEWGFFTFYFLYFYQLLRYGYREISFEKEAREFARKVLDDNLL